MTPDISGDLGSILSVWGHPDDEAWLAAGLMMRAVGAGRRVVCVTATRGEAGFPDDDPRDIEERAAIRAAEMGASLAVMGVTEHRWLDYGDGRCSTVDDAEATARIADIIREVRPDTVLCFGPDGATGHSDHIATCRWTTAAVHAAGLPGTRLLYATKTSEWADRFYAGIDLNDVMMTDELDMETVEPDELAVYYSCDDELAARKVSALRAQESQIERFVAEVGVPAFTELVREEFYRDPRPADAELMERARRFGRP